MHDQQQEATAQPLFILHPENRPFAEGKAPYPSGTNDYQSSIFLLSAMLLLPLIAAGFAVWLWVEPLKLALWGVDIQGEVIARRTVEGGFASGTQKVQYHFDVVGPDGERQVYENTHEVTGDAYEQLLPETQAPVRYLPDDPQVSQMKGHRNTHPSGITTLAFLLFGIFGPLLGWYLVAARRERRRMRQGTIVRGTVLSCRGYHPSKDTFRVIVSYRFWGPDTDIPEQHGEASATRTDLKDQPLPEAGTPVLVWYLDSTHAALL
jgi:hypothetical protein